MLTAVPDSTPRIGGLVGRVGQDRNHPAPDGKPLLYPDGAACGRCPICLERTDASVASVAIYPCGHSFCGKCDARMDDGAPLRKCAVCRAETPRDQGPVEYPLAPALRSGHAAYTGKMATFEGLAPAPWRGAAARRGAADSAPVEFGFAAGARGFATLLVVPPAPAADKTRATLYVLDKSGSMSNDFPNVVETMQAVLEASIGSYVAVVVFSTTAHTVVLPHCVSSDSIPATMAALRGVAAGGNTQLHLALETAESVVQEMRARIAADGKLLVVLALVVTDGSASAPALAASALKSASRSMEVYVAGYGSQYSFDDCQRLFADGPQSAANFAHAANPAALAALLGERRVFGSARVTCPPDSEIYCNGRVTQVDASGQFDVAFDPAQGVRFAVESSTALDVSTVAVGGTAAPFAHSAALGLEVANFMRSTLTLQYVMDLGSMLPDHDTHTLRSLLSHVSRVVRKFPDMSEVAKVIATQIARTVRRSDGDSNVAADTAGHAIRSLSCPVAR